VTDETQEIRAKQHRGFALMTPEKRKEIAARGGSAVPAHLRSFTQSRELAASAGKKGGSTSRGGGRPRK
jgi:uncharacterized protein